MINLVVVFLIHKKQYFVIFYKLKSILSLTFRHIKKSTLFIVISIIFNGNFENCYTDFLSI